MMTVSQNGHITHQYISTRFRDSHDVSYVCIYQPWLVRMRAATWRFWQNHAVVPNPKDQSRLIKKEEFMVYMVACSIHTYIHENAAKC